MQEIFFEHAQGLHYEEIPQVTRHLRGRGRPDRHPVAEQYHGASERRPREATGPPDAQQTLERDDAQEGQLGAYALPDGGPGAGGTHEPLEYEEFAFEAMGLNEEDPVRYWSEKSAEQERLVGRLEEAREIRIVGPDTDLTLSVEDGRS